MERKNWSKGRKEIVSYRADVYAVISSSCEWEENRSMQRGPWADTNPLSFRQAKPPATRFPVLAEFPLISLRMTGNSAALEPHISNQASLSAKAPGEAISLPKSGEGRTACLTVVCCGQIAVYRGNLRCWVGALVVGCSGL